MVVRAVPSGPVHDDRTSADRPGPSGASGPNQSPASTTSPSTDTHSVSASSGRPACGMPGPTLIPTAGTRSRSAHTASSGGA
ncbi:Uncharacterised protein [Mycobacteroides abscessus]|nr:Uncharacterised protein [Mycobacteroides abscessus]